MTGPSGVPLDFALGNFASQPAEHHGAEAQARFERQGPPGGLYPGGNRSEWHVNIAQPLTLENDAGPEKGSDETLTMITQTSDRDSR